MRLDCVIGIIIITININNKVLLSALFLLQRDFPYPIFTNTAQCLGGGETVREGQIRKEEKGKRGQRKVRGRTKGESEDCKDAGNKEGGEERLDNQDSTTVCKRASPAVSKLEEVACAP